MNIRVINTWRKHGRKRSRNNKCDRESRMDARMGTSGYEEDRRRQKGTIRRELLEREIGVTRKQARRRNTGEKSKQK